MTSHENTRIPLSEKVFGVCALLYASTAFIRLIMSPDEYAALGDEALASPVKRVLWAITYAMAAYFLSKRYTAALEVLRKTPLLIALMVYIAASALWSESRSISILSVAALTGNTLVGLYFGTRYGIAQFLKLLGLVCGIIAVSVALAPLVSGAYATSDGFWTGFFAQKNALGMNATIGFLVFVMLARSTRERKWLYHTLSALCAVLVFLSGSTTCIVIFFVLVCAMLWSFFVKKYALSTSSQVVILTCAATVILLFWRQILSALGSSETFIGRIGMWAVLISMVRDKLLLGYGYGGFWLYGGPAQTVWDSLGVDPSDASYAHNGYVQVLVDGGIIGLGLLLSVVFMTLRKAWAYSSATKNMWPIYFMAFLVLHNLTEGTFAARNNICWLLFVAVSVQLVRVLDVNRGEAPGAMRGERARPRRLSGSGLAPAS